MLVSAPVQFYLFICFRAYLRRQISHVAMRSSLILVSAIFIALMFLPMVWRAYAGLYGDWRYPRGVLAILIASLVWWIGSLGCAGILLAVSCFQRLTSPNRRTAPFDAARRDFLCTGIGMAAAAPFMVSGYAVVLERQRFQVEHFSIGLTGLPSPLSSFRIVQLTDIHVGPFMRPEQLLAYVRAVNRLDPDLIALTGDFIAGAEDEVAPCVEALAGLTSRYGIFACLGNHEIYAGAAARITELFADRGIHMLVNDAATICVGDSRIAILGIDDLRAGSPDLRQALSAVENHAGGVKILLSHRPEIFHRAAQHGIDLVISGHYHGGQVKLLPQPSGLSIARFLTPFAEGVFQIPGMTGGTPDEQKAKSLFVGRGIGITGLPIRINCPPQIAHLTLTKA
jgi:predicted MPP superfamily phosphohydrolase